MRTLRLFKRGGASVLGPLEKQIMDIVWSSPEPVTVADVHSALGKRGKELAYSTVKAVLTNLTSKNYLKRRSEGRSNNFAARESREKFKEKVVSEVLNSLVRDHRDQLLVQLVEDLAVDRQSISELERLIAKKRGALAKK